MSRRRDLAPTIVAAILVAVFSFAALQAVWNFRECREHGFSLFYCWTHR
jgi:hypothetical protein